MLISFFIKQQSILNVAMNINIRIGNLLGLKMYKQGHSKQMGLAEEGALLNRAEDFSNDCDRVVYKVIKLNNNNNYIFYFIFMLIATLIFTLICISNANLGVDMYQSFNNYKCMMESGYTFLITRAYRSLGEVDYIGVNNLKAAKEAGMITDVYFFPCKDKKSTTQQVQEFLEVYSIVKDDYGTVWVDVEENPSTSCAWSTTDYQSNCEFLTELVATLKAFNQLVGIYASKHQWEVIFGSATACSNFTSLPLWYAHYDQIPSFADYSKYSFGGWTKPSIKQYSGGTSICGAWVDADFY